jgi:hypothetical protein
MLLDQKALAEIPEWEYRFVSLVLKFFLLLSRVSAHLVSHHHITPFPPYAVRLSKIVTALPPMMPNERAHRKIRLRPSCSRLRGIIPQQIAFAMLPPPQPLRFPLTLNPLFALTLTLGLPLPPILISPPISLPLLLLLTLALTPVSNHH